MADLTVGAGIARRLIELAVTKGASVNELTARSAIRLEDLEDQDNRIPMPKYVTLLREAKVLTDDPALALHFGESVDMQEFSIVGLLAHACETIQEALVQVNRYGRLVTEVDTGEQQRFQLVQKAGQVWMVDTRRSPNDFWELTEATFARFTTMAHRLTERPLVLEVHVTHAPPPYRAEYERIFQAPVVFAADWNALRLDEAGLTTPLASQPRYAFGVFSRHSEALLQKLESTKSVRGTVESLLIQTVHTGETSIASVANKMGLSRDTLYRRLKAEGATFETVLDELRHRMAIDYLSAKKVSVTETAYLVGFSDPAAFSRAFKRWTGKSPSAFRAQF